MSRNAERILSELELLGDAQAAKNAQRFFKTGKGEYGEGDYFIGIRMPVLRKVASKHQATPLGEVLEVLK